jgi:hypothetical protein
MPDGADHSASADDGNPFAVDVDVAHPARLQSFLAGGASHFAADRAAAEKMAAALPRGVDTARHVVRVLGAFVGRAMRHLAAEAGVRQFVTIGVAPPGERNIHDVVRDVAPDARFVYVSDDPVVLAESHVLRRGAPEGAVAYAHGSLPDLPAILHQETSTLDLAQPMAVALVTTLSFVPDESGPHAMVAELMGTVAPGSHLVVAHPSFDISAAGMREASEHLSHGLNVPWVVRRRDEIERFFVGLDMVEPGLVPIEEWRPDGARPLPPDRRVTPIFAGMGRKP